MKKHYLAAFDLLPLLHLFCKTRPALLMVGSLLAMLTALAGMALLGLSGWFISATALAGLTLVTAQAFDVFMPSSGIRLFTLLRTFARYGERLVTHDATLAILADLRVRLFRGLAMSEAALSLARRPARLLFRLTGDIDALDSLYLRLLTPMGATLCAILAASLTLGWVQPELGLAVLLSTSLSTLVILDRTWTSAVFPARLRARAIEALRSDAADLVAGQSELLLADRLEAQCDRIAHVDARLAKYDDRLHWVDTRAALSFAVLGHALLAGTLATVGWLVNDETIGVPVAVFAILVAMSLGEPLSGLRRGALEMGRTTLAVRRLTPHLNDQGDRRPHPEPPAENTTTAIHLQGVSARHPDSDSACILGIDLHVQSGERIALVGSSGTGKSSLIAMITGEMPILTGQVRSVRYGWLTQRTELFQDSLRDNLRLACPAAEDARLWHALETAGLADDVRSWPDGLDTWLGESGQGLSGGQARRLALARLLLRKAPLWLLDEPTEGLDASTARDVLARLDRHGHKHTWLLATHLRREAQLAERLILMHQGQIEADHRRGTEGYVALLNSLRID